jgi:hypothetical protein
MKNPIRSLALGIALTVCLGNSAMAASQSFTNQAVAVANSTFVNLTLNQFNPSLGTLTNVQVTINFVALAGNFSVTATTATAANVASDDDPATDIRIRGTGLGYTQVDTTETVTTTPGVPFTVPGNSEQTFLVSPESILLNNSQTISAGSFGAYTGTGLVTFQVRSSPDIVVAGGAFTLDAIPFTATANMTVNYTYTPTAAIPEPGQVAASLLLMGGIGAYYFVKRRRKSVPSAA